jgi:2-hydroxy-3-oxopropionate reductase
MLRIGFIGLGFMGKGMASNIARGLPPHSSRIIDKLNLYDIDESKCKYISSLHKDKSINVASSIEEIASLSDVICLSLPSEEACKSLIFDDKSGLLKYWKNSENKTIIDHGTFSNSFVTTNHHKCKLLGVEYMDAPVSGGPGKYLYL